MRRASSSCDPNRRQPYLPLVRASMYFSRTSPRPRRLRPIRNFCGFRKRFHREIAEPCSIDQETGRKFNCQRLVRVNKSSGDRIRVELFLFLHDSGAVGEDYRTSVRTPGCQGSWS